MSDTKELETPVLEVPSSPDASVSLEMGALFTDESIALASAKLSVVETLLNLAVKDIKFHDFMREVLLSVMRVVKSEAGSILEVNHADHTLFFRAVAGQSSDRLSKFVIPMGKGIVGHVAESRLPLVVSNVEENRVHLKSIQDAVGFNARNLVAVPILVRGKIFGVLELLNRVGEDDYSSYDVELLNYLCEMAAKAIEVRLMLAWSSGTQADRKAA